MSISIFFSCICSTSTICYFNLQQKNNNAFLFYSKSCVLFCEGVGKALCLPVCSITRESLLLCATMNLYFVNVMFNLVNRLFVRKSLWVDATKAKALPYNMGRAAGYNTWKSHRDGKYCNIGLQSVDKAKK
ncbi:hypothetical protein MCEGE10_00026 [Flavobacteriaceae bacterium]